MHLYDKKLYDERVGRYKVGNSQYDNKWDAMIHASAINGDYIWEYNPEIFDKFDWSKPIQFSLDELYVMRLNQLREQYDYLILFFSGGKDSTNILLTAVNNNIHIDEIVVYYPFAMEKYFNDKDHDSDNLYSEVEYAAKPLLKKLENKLTKTKIRFQDIGDTTNKFTQNTDWFDQVRPPNTLQMVSPSNGGVCDVELIKLALEGKRVCVIVGVDKPTIVEVDGSYYFKFVDASFSTIPRPRSKEMKSQYDFICYEPFYQTPAFPELTIKQAQVIADAYDIDPSLRTLQNFTHHVKFNVVYSERERIMATYLYSDGITPWQTLKHKKHLFRRGEKVVWQTLSNEVKDNYINAVKSITKKVHPKFFVGEDYILGPKPCFSKSYFIKKAQIK